MNERVISLEVRNMRPVNVVIATDKYGIIRIPGWFRAAVDKWVASKDFPKGIPMTIDETGLVIDLRPLRRTPRSKASRKSRNIDQ